jgi:hypothetical protein
MFADAGGKTSFCVTISLGHHERRSPKHNLNFERHLVIRGLFSLEIFLDWWYSAESFFCLSSPRWLYCSPCRHFFVALFPRFHLLPVMQFGYQLSHQEHGIYAHPSQARMPSTSSLSFWSRLLRKLFERHVVCGKQSQTPRFLTIRLFINFISRRSLSRVLGRFNNYRTLSTCKGAS